GRGGQTWIVIAAEHAPLVRALAGTAGLRVLEGAGSSVALAAVERDAARIAEIVAQLDVTAIDPRVEGWLERATTWHGTIEVAGPPGAPVFVLIGEAGRLPPALRDVARAVPDGASLALTLASWRLIEGQRLRGWGRQA